MPNHKHHITLLLLTTVLCIGQLHTLAQQEFSSQPIGRGKYAMVVYLSGGAGTYTAEGVVPSPVNASLTKTHGNTMLRVMWHPDHLLRFGIETGSMTMYGYAFTDSLGRKGDLALKATPVLAEWSMALTKRINIFAGSGVYILTTDLDYLSRTRSRKFSIGWMAAASYIQPVSSTAGIGLEAKYLSAAETRNGVIALQLQFVWRFLQW